MERKCYVYRHIRLDKNQVFYVGVGTKEKEGEFRYVRAHSKNRSKFWKRVATKTPYEVDIILDNLTHKEADEKEKEFIKLYKRVGDGGTLTNLTLGGEGWLGCKHTEEHKKYISEVSKRRRLTEEQKLRVGDFHRGKKLSREHYLAFAFVNKGKKDSSKVLEKKRQNCKKNLLVLNSETGIYYVSISETARALCINRRKLSDMLRQQNKYKNYTSLRVI